MSEARRPRARWIATAGLLTLGALALARLPLDDLPRHSFPELRIGLRLAGGGSGGGSGDWAEIGRDGLREVESAVRAAGGVRAMAGTVRRDGADLTVLFARGTDPERKAARVDSELTALRRRLPAGSALQVETGGGDTEPLALVWLTGVRREPDVEAAAEAIRAVPGVRSVETYGSPREEVRVALRAGSPRDPAALARAEAIRAELARCLRVPRLGEARAGDRLRPVIAAPVAVSDLARWPVPAGAGAVPLGAVADVRTRWLPPELTVRYGGEAARALLVYRAPGAPLLATDRALRARLRHLPGGLQGTVGANAAAPLRALLSRLGLGLLLAALAGAALGEALGGWRGALALAVAPTAALAAAANLFWLGGIPLHLTTLLALALGTAPVLPLAALRQSPGHTGGERPGRFRAAAFTTVAAAGCVPVAVALAGERLAPLLGEPARALLLAAAGAALAAALLPVSRDPGPGLPGLRRAARLQRRSLRDPGTAILAAGTAALAAAVLCGAALLPHPADLSPQTSDLQVRVTLPEGTPLSETERRLVRIEEQLAAAPEIETFWAFARAGAAEIHVELRPRERRPDLRSRFAARLAYILPQAAGQIETGRPAGERGFAIDLEDRPEIAPEAQSYRVVLRSADFEALRDGYDRILNRLDVLKIRGRSIQGWGTPSLRRTLRPAAGTPPGDLAPLAAWLESASRPLPPIPLPAAGADGRDRRLRVTLPGMPENPDEEAPQEADLLARPVPIGGRTVLPAAALEVTEEVSYPRVSRQSGRYVVPITIQLPYSTEEGRRKGIREIDRNLAQIQLPAACQLERPAIRRTWLPRDQRPLLALALTLPLLLGAVAACRLDSLLRAGAALVPSVLGLLAAAPLIQASGGEADELTLFALAAALALALPPAAEAAAGETEAAAGSAGPSPTRAGRLYRSLRRQSPWLLGTLPAVLLGLAVPTLGVDPTRFRWVLPLQAAALSGAVALAAAAVLVTPLRLAAARARERDPGEVRRLRQPPAWNEPGPPTLTVRSVTKIYRAGRFRALSGVSFELGPGIVGLLGPNGAGKTTLLRILTGLLEPTRGSVSFRGVPVSSDPATGNLAEYRRRIGFLPQELNAYPGFTAEQFLDHWALERGMRDPLARRREIEKLLADVGLSEHAGRKVRDFSGGMRQRIGIARALLGAPPILIVDEPTTGLDVESRNRFRQILLETAGERIVLFSTHIASDVEAAAVRLLLLYRGQLCFDGTPEELVSRARGRVFRTVVADADLQDFSHLYRVTARVRILEGIQVRALVRPDETPAGEAVEPDLEEAYLAEIDRVDAEAGRPRRRAERFGFLKI